MTDLGEIAALIALAVRADRCMRRWQERSDGINVALGDYRCCEPRPSDWHKPAVLVPLLTSFPKGARTITLAVGGLNDTDGSNLAEGIGKDPVGYASPGQVEIRLISCPIFVVLGRPEISSFDFLPVRLFMVNPPKSYVFPYTAEAFR